MCLWSSPQCSSPAGRHFKCRIEPPGIGSGPGGSDTSGPALEVVSIADIPAGTGLGSSGSFTVGLLRAIYAFKREHITTGALAEEACRIEIDLLRRAVGKQDQYIAAFGGLSCFEFDHQG